MSYRINFGDEAVCLPAKAIDGCGELLQLKLLMLLSYERHLCDADISVLAERLDCSIKELEDTVASLRAIELIEPEKKLSRSAESKNLNGEEIALIIKNDKNFSQLVDECQNICGKIFTPTDISKLVNIKKQLMFDSETILLLFFYLAEKLDAIGKKLSVSYAERSAYSLYNQGIRSHGDLQLYIKQTEERNSFSFKIRRLFGIGERSFTKKEKKFFDKWNLEWSCSYELIEYAYDVTVDRTGKPGLEYMSKILSDLHDSGITTVEQAEKNSEEFKNSDRYRKKFTERKRDGDASDNSSFNTQEFFEKALKRSYAMMNEDGKKE